jgi:hypothetical protein
MVTVGLFGIFCGIVRCKSIPLLPAPVATWRKHFLGRGRLASDVAKAQAMKRCKQLGWTAADHNGAEAAGIWSWACAQQATLFARAT